MIRAIGVVCIVLVAILVTPEALRPGFNSADLIVTFAPLAVVVVGWPRRSTARPPRAVSPHYAAGRAGRPQRHGAPTRKDGGS